MGFSIPLQQVAEKMGLRLEDVTRKVTLDLFTDVVNRSPVGNPELWIANESAGVGKSSREAYAEAAIAYNEANPRKRRVGTSAAAIAKALPLVAGKGYVGGRFRANWNVSVGTPDESTTDSTDKSRSMAEVLKTQTLPIGKVTYLTNALPYAVPLEHGHSTQAPSGMVRLAAISFSDKVNEAIREVK